MITQLENICINQGFETLPAKNGKNSLIVVRKGKKHVLTIIENEERIIVRSEKEGDDFFESCDKNDIERKSDLLHILNEQLKTLKTDS